MYKKIALVALLLSVSSLTFAGEGEAKKKSKKGKWATTEQSCAKIDKQLAKYKGKEGFEKKLKNAEKRKVKCVAKG